MCRTTLAKKFKKNLNENLRFFTQLILPRAGADVNHVNNFYYGFISLKKSLTHTYKLQQQTSITMDLSVSLLLNMHDPDRGQQQATI